MLFLKKNSWGIALGLITILGAYLRLHLLGDYTVDRDEFARIVPEFTFTSLIPPGIFLLTKISGSLFNYTDFGYRFPSFLFGVFGIISIYFLGRTFFGKLEGILSAFVLSLLLNHIVYSNQTKEYVPLITFTTLSSILVFKIISSFLGREKTKKRIYLFYLAISLLAPLFSSYFYFLVILYQVIILFTVKIFVYFKNNSPAKIVQHSPLNLFLSIGVLCIIFLSYFLMKQMNAYFGLTLIFPTFTFVNNYWHELGYFVTQDEVWTKFTNLFFLVGVIPLLSLRKFQLGVVYIISFTSLDFLLTSSLRFTSSAFPLQYIRYHAFLMPTYVVMVAGTIGGLAFLLKKKQLIIAALVVGFFLVFTIKRAYPMIRWYYESASYFINPNFKDDGAFLSANLKKGDTLVRVKNFGMDHKFNHVNHYIDRKVFKEINYSIFPQRTAENNWYAPLAAGDEDEQGFSDYLFVERIRTSLRNNTPLISKLKYFGPFIKTRLLKDKDSWEIKTSVGQETAKALIDGDINTFWDPTTGNKESILIDLGRVHILNSVRFVFHTVYPDQFSVFLSEDGLTKQKIYDYDSTSPSYHNHQLFFVPTKARFITIEIKNAAIREINLSEVYEDTAGINKEDTFIGESIVMYNFADNLQGWTNGQNIADLRIRDGELSARVLTSGAQANVNVTFDPKINLSEVNFINFALRTDSGNKASLVLKTLNKEFLIDNIKLIQNNLLNYYSFNLDDYHLSKEDRRNLRSLYLFPSNAGGAEFSLDFLSLDRRNLPGIQVKDSNSPDGFSQFIPYRKDEDYTFFQIGDKLNLPKGKYIAHFKIKATKIDPDWMSKREPAPVYRMHEYLEPKGDSDHDILYVSLESTRGTFYDSPAYMNIIGEKFKEANKYYEFNLPFKSDGKETFFFQAFNPKNRRYPADLYITFPEIEAIK